MFDSKQDNFCELCKTFSEHTTPIFLWLGAGLSVDAGFPTWEQLRKIMIEKAERFLSTVDEDTKSLGAIKLQLASKETNYWKAFEHIAEAVGHSEYDSYVQQIFGVKVTLPKLLDSDVFTPGGVNTSRISPAA